MTAPELPQDDPRLTLRLPTAADCAQATQRLLGGARQWVRILAQRADLRYLTDDAVIAALRALLVRSRRARLEILLPPELARDDLGRPLWDLARHLTSAVAVHRLSDDNAPLAEAWLTVDRHGYLHRPQAERLHGLACLDDPQRTNELIRRFAAAWLASEPDPDLRRLSL